MRKRGEGDDPGVVGERVFGGTVCVRQARNSDLRQGGTLEEGKKNSTGTCGGVEMEKPAP